MFHILVVDDEMAICHLMRDVLEDEGYAVSTVEDGSAALRRIRSDPPDLVLMDVMLPGMDGRDVARAVHRQPALSELPIILMSAAVRHAPADIGNVEFVPKPFDLDDLLSAVGRALRRSARQYRARAAANPTARQPAVSRQLGYSAGPHGTHQS